MLSIKNLLILSLVFVLTVVAYSQEEISFSRYPNGLIKIGLGPEALDSNLHRLLSGETEDDRPTLIAFRDSLGQDTISVMLSARTKQDTIRVVMMTLPDSTILASISYRRLSDTTITYIPNLSIELDSGIVLDSFNVTPLADSLIKETLKWTSIGIYISTLQSDKNMNELQGENDCVTCIMHDMVCTPSTINEIGIQYFWCPIRWITLTDCCRQHDIDWFCAPGQTIADRLICKEIADQRVATCMFGKIFNDISSNTPWWCGGYITGAIVGAISGTITAVMVELLLKFIYTSNFNEYIGKGYRTNSCLCGGSVRTIACKTGPLYTEGGIICEGSALEWYLIDNITGCNSFIAETLIVSPNVPGATYSVSCIGGVSLDSQNNNIFVISAVSKGIITITVTSECGTVVLQKNISVDNPPKPTLTFSPQPCYPLFNYGTVTAYSPGATSYIWSCSAGILLLDYPYLGVRRWETTGYDLPYCISVQALNECGESEVLTFCDNTGHCTEEVFGYIENHPISKRNIILIDPDAIQNNDNYIVIFPNPTSGKLTISLANNYNYRSFMITNLLNGIVSNDIRINNRNFEIDLKDLTTGVYVLTFLDANLNRKNRIIHIIK